MNITNNDNLYKWFMRSKITKNRARKIHLSVCQDKQILQESKNLIYNVPFAILHLWARWQLDFSSPVLTYGTFCFAITVL